LETLNDILLRWKLKADNDLKTIEHEFASPSPVTDTICYHAQQAVEKYLKLFLVHNSFEPAKTHNIFTLLQECEKIESSFSQFANIAYLTDYAVSLRYPDNFYIPDIDEAKEAYDDALSVKKFVCSVLSL
jgi:HEPN domain-containing protein